MFDPMQPYIQLDDEPHFSDRDNPPTSENIREYLRDHPELVAKTADLGRHAEDRLINQICNEDEKAAICLRAKLDQMRKDLEEEGDPPVLRLLSNRVVLNWLWLHFLDVVDAATENDPCRAGIALTRKREAAHRMFLAATKMHSTLARSMRRGRQSTKRSDEHAA